MEYFPTNQSTPEFLVGVDHEGCIECEYTDYKGDDPEAPIRTLLQRIMDGTGLFILRLPAELSMELLLRLDEHKCLENIEPQLFGVAETSEGVLVRPNDHEALVIERGYLKPGVLQCIQEGSVGPTVSSLAEILVHLRRPHEYGPETMSDLAAFLHQHRVGEKIEEREYLEFKAPKVPFLSQGLLRDAVKAICAMLNTREGWVIIGVDDDTGEIAPFPPRYNSESKEISVDQLLRDIWDEVERICPMPRTLVNIWPILDEERRNCVIVARVHKGCQNYLYRTNRGSGANRIAKWIRCGPRTVLDPTWICSPTNEIRSQI
jgi:hypothetical protein